MTDPQFASTLFDSLVDAGTSPQEVIDGGFEQLITNIQRQANEIAEVVWDEAIKRLKDIDDPNGLRAGMFDHWKKQRIEENE